MNRILITLFLLFVPVVANAGIKLVSSDLNGFVCIEYTELGAQDTVFYIPRSKIIQIRIYPHNKDLCTLFIGFCKDGSGKELYFSSPNEALVMANQIVMNSKSKANPLKDK